MSFTLAIKISSYELLVISYELIQLVNNQYLM